MPEQPLLFTYWLLRHPPFPTQSVGLSLVTYPSLCSTCVTYRMPCHAIGHRVLSTQPLPREAEDFPRGDLAILGMCLCAHTQLGWNQLFNNLKLIFKHVKIKNVLLVVKSLTKITATLIISCKSTVIQK